MQELSVKVIQPTATHNHVNFAMFMYSRLIVQGYNINLYQS